MIGDKIRERRIELGLTQAQLSIMTGIKSTTISNYENNISSPSDENIYKFMETLKCDANYLFEWEEVKDIQLSLDEKNIIKKYRTLDEHGKDMVDTVLGKEYERSKLATNIAIQSTEPKKYTAQAVAFGGDTKSVEMTQEQYNEIAELLKSFEKK